MEFAYLIIFHLQLLLLGFSHLSFLSLFTRIIFFINIRSYYLAQDRTSDSTFFILNRPTNSNVSENQTNTEEQTESNPPSPSKLPQKVPSRPSPLTFEASVYSFSPSKQLWFLLGKGNEIGDFNNAPRRFHVLEVTDKIIIKTHSGDELISIRIHPDISCVPLTPELISIYTEDDQAVSFLFDSEAEIASFVRHVYELLGMEIPEEFEEVVKAHPPESEKTKADDETPAAAAPTLDGPAHTEGEKEDTSEQSSAVETYYHTAQPPVLFCISSIKRLLDPSHDRLALLFFLLFCSLFLVFLFPFLILLFFFLLLSTQLFFQTFSLITPLSLFPVAQSCMRWRLCRSILL